MVRILCFNVITFIYIMFLIWVFGGAITATVRYVECILISQDWLDMMEAKEPNQLLAQIVFSLRNSIGSLPNDETWVKDCRWYAFKGFIGGPCPMMIKVMSRFLGR